MKIEFKIEEKMADIVTEIFHSDKWRSIVKNECACLQRVAVEDFMGNIIAFVEIWKQEIHIKIACSCATYRIFCRQNHVICEYIGALSEFLGHHPFPKLTPVKDFQHILDDKKPEFEWQSEDGKLPSQARLVYDEFIYDDLPMPYFQEAK